MMQRKDLAFVMSMDLERPSSLQKKVEVSPFAGDRDDLGFKIEKRRMTDITTSLE
jgi:hypothetical protein